jgi:uncharacterized alkaline shock family protein YloU
MKTFANVFFLFCITIIIVINLVVIAFVLEVLKLQQIMYYLQTVETDLKLRYIVGAISGMLILLCFSITRIISGVQQKERTIAFDNPSGRVTISLNAVEDLIRRLMYRLPEIKEIRPNIIATKKGLEVDARVTLKADTNIPDLTSRLQDLVRSKIQDIIGIDETVTVQIHVVKILTDENKGKSKKDEGGSRQDFTVPFQGYTS